LPELYEKNHCPESGREGGKTMTKILCQEENCKNNKDWVCQLELLHIKLIEDEPTPFFSINHRECRDFQKVATKTEAE